MSVRIARAALLAVREDCARRLPEEACGLLLGDAGAERIDLAVPAANVASDRRRAFEIDPAVLFDAHRKARAGGPAIVGCYHSHPSAPPAPSEADAMRAFDAGWVWLIVANGAERAYRVTESGRIRGRFEEVLLVVEE